MATSGSRARGGARRGARTRPRLSRSTIITSTAALVALLGWAVLVWTAIGFGRTARGGDTQAWVWLALTCLAAVACLFGCLLMVRAVLRQLATVDQRGPRRH